MPFPAVFGTTTTTRRLINLLHPVPWSANRLSLGLDVMLSSNYNSRLQRSLAVVGPWQIWLISTGSFLLILTPSKKNRRIHQSFNRNRTRHTKASCPVLTLTPEPAPQAQTSININMIATA